MDFVFVQFYNNGDCNIGQPGFAASLKAWSQDLSAKGAGPKMYIGAPGCAACAGSGYLGAEQMKGVIDGAMAAGLSNFGGVMLWDGPEGKANVEGEETSEIPPLGKRNQLGKQIQCLQFTSMTESSPSKIMIPAPRTSK
ncbi:MAG: hypothetical protein Q9172_005265 [Xanthocarpia lactea]